MSHATLDALTNVILVGLRASGKSTLGPLLAQTLQRPWVDLDEVLAQRAGCDIDTLLTRDGEAGFRRAERDVLVWAAGLEGHVIATGGGAVLHEAEAAALAGSGVVVYLDLPLAELARRAAQRPRPALTALAPSEELAALAAQRAPRYAALAHITVRSGDPVPILDAIHRWSKKQHG
ncbi:MAG: shikimate kinase II [Planctomycetota bacterium]|nr:MAG: shikimate kinase II [Planctomycetota bacterium]